MSGFGKDLRSAKINSQLYRKVSWENMEVEGGEYCTSTPESQVLIGRGDFCFVFSEKEREGLYDNKDADAGKDFGYDEFRVGLEKDELEYIVYPDWWVNVMNEIEENGEADERYDNPEEDPYLWIDRLQEELPGVPILSESEYKEETGDNINFNF